MILHVSGALGQAEQTVVNTKRGNSICWQAFFCPDGRVNGVARSKPQSHAASESKRSLWVASVNHGSSRGPLWEALEGVRAPRCVWEPGGSICLYFEANQGTGKALSTPAASASSALSEGFGCLFLGPALMPWSKMGGGITVRGLVRGFWPWTWTIAGVVTVILGLRLTSVSISSTALLSQLGTVGWHSISLTLTCQPGCHTWPSAWLLSWSSPFHLLSSGHVPATVVSHFLLPQKRKPNVRAKQKAHFTPRRSHRPANESLDLWGICHYIIKGFYITQCDCTWCTVCTFPDYPLPYSLVDIGHLVPVKIHGLQNCRFFFLSFVLGSDSTFCIWNFPKVCNLRQLSGMKIFILNSLSLTM